MPDCYVYYRVAVEHAPAARLALNAMLGELESSLRVAGRVYCKAHEPLLWMEVYTGVRDPDALVALLAGLAERHGLNACLAEDERRHVEHFIPLKPQ
jgi:hypothetical protein